MKRLIKKLHNSNFLGSVLHILDHCLQKELSDCGSVLDLGCGPASPIRQCENIKHSVGVEVFRPYLEESKKKNIHSEYLEKNIEDLDFGENSFDAVVLIEVLEHLPEKSGLEILEKAHKWSKKKVLLSTPNGYFPMGAVDGNNYQRHLSGWSLGKLKDLGYKVYGMSGMKFLYHDKNSVHSLVGGEPVFSNIRFRPKALFYMFNGILQILAYYIPRTAFGLFAVRKK